MYADDIQRVRKETQYRILKYAQVSNIPYSVPDQVIACPRCKYAAQLIPAPGKNSYTWKCDHCKIGGDLFDYAREFGCCKTESETFRNVCRKLEIPITQLEAYTAQDIMDMDFADRTELIQGFLGKGLYILGGAPKTGKSFLVLQFGHYISLGQAIWGMPTVKSGVLYLSLEDPMCRVQLRLVQETGGETGDLIFATQAEMLRNGLEQQLRSFLTDHPTVKLVIIDTLQRIRQNQYDGYSYAGDYADLILLKELADQFEITVLVVHHTRKKDDADVMNMLSGTLGLAGCADGVMILQRPGRMSSSGILTAISRENGDIRMELEFDSASFQWKLVRIDDSQSIQSQDPVLTAVKKIISEKGSWKGSATELLDELKAEDPELDMKPNVLSRRLRANKQILHDQFSVLCQWKRSENAKYIELKDISDREQPAEPIP